jgi:hypothetical protein
VTALGTSTTAPLLAGTHRGGIFKSGDDGDTWTAVNVGFNPDLTVTSIAVDPPEGDSVVVGTGKVYAGGIFVSSDATTNTSWAEASSGLGSLDVRALIALPGASAAPSPFWAGTGVGVYRSLDSGTTWTGVTIDTSTGLLNLSISALAVNPADANEIWAATRGGGVFTTTDGGTSWTQISAGLPDLDITAMTYNPISTTIYAGTGANGVYIFDDVSTTWAATGGTTQLASLEVLCLAVDQADETRCYAGTALGLHYTTDSGANWATPGGANDPSDLRIISLLVDPSGASERVLAGGYSHGINLTNDAVTGTMDFDPPLTNNIQAADIRAVAADPITASRFYAGGGYDLSGGTSIGEQNTGNDGGSWTPPGTAPSTDNVAAFAFFDGATDALFAAVNGSGVWVSTSAPLGSTWNLSWTGPTSNDVLTVAVLDSSAPGVLLAGCDTTGLWRSVDGGANWTQDATLGANASVRDFAVEPGSILNVYAATGTGVYFSTDGGASWTASTTQPSFAVGAASSSSTLSVVVDPVTFTTVYAGTSGGGVFVSSDSAAAFTEANLHIEGSGNVKVYDMIGQTGTTNYVYGATSVGVYRTADMAASWNPVHDQAVTDPLRKRIVVGRSLAINPNNASELWVGCAGRGVLTVTLP